MCHGRVVIGISDDGDEIEDDDDMGERCETATKAAQGRVNGGQVGNDRESAGSVPFLLGTASFDMLES